MFDNPTTFRTITVDSGSEFLDYMGIARSTLNPEKARTQVFFCYAYCSWERGDNEKEPERRINKYPRGIFGYKSAAKMFKGEFGDLIFLLC